MARAKPASWRVAGKRCATRPMADSPCHFQESPKSPRTALLRKMKYWVWSGLSSPQCLATRSYSSGPASSGNITSRGLPLMRARVNTMRVITQMVNRLWRALLAMYRCMNASCTGRRCPSTLLRGHRALGVPGLRCPD